MISPALGLVAHSTDAEQHQSWSTARIITLLFLKRFEFQDRSLHRSIRQLAVYHRLVRHLWVGFRLMRKDWPNCCLIPVFCFGTMHFPIVACCSKIGCRLRKCIFDSEKHQYTQKDEIDIMSRNVKQHAFACCCWNVYVINILETKYHWLYFSVFPRWFPFLWINGLNWSWPTR